MSEIQNLEASFSTLALSIASSAMTSLGFAPNPSTGETELDINMAKFNIDLLQLLQEKTKNNLTDEEDKFLKQVLSDLQMRFIEKNK